MTTKSEEDILEQPSRREFLETAGKGLVGLAGLVSGVGSAAKAQAATKAEAADPARADTVKITYQATIVTPIPPGMAVEPFDQKKPLTPEEQHFLDNYVVAPTKDKRQFYLLQCTDGVYMRVVPKNKDIKNFTPFKEAVAARTNAEWGAPVPQSGRAANAYNKLWNQITYQLFDFAAQRGRAKLLEEREKKLRKQPPPLLSRYPIPGVILTFFKNPKGGSQLLLVPVIAGEDKARLMTPQEVPLFQKKYNKRFYDILSWVSFSSNTISPTFKVLTVEDVFQAKDSAFTTYTILQDGSIKGFSSSFFEDMNKKLTSKIKDKINRALAKPFFPFISHRNPDDSLTFKYRKTGKELHPVDYKLRVYKRGVVKWSNKTSSALPENHTKSEKRYSNGRVK